MNPNATQIPQLPWAGLPNVKCSLQRTQAGEWVGQCVIQTVQGGQPIVLTAKANERDVYAFLRERYGNNTQAAAAGAWGLGQLASQAQKMAKARVMQKLSQGYKRVAPAARRAVAAVRSPAQQQKLAVMLRGAKQLGISPWQAARLAHTPLSKLPVALRHRLAQHRAHRGQRPATPLPRRPAARPAVPAGAVQALKNAATLLSRSRAGVPTARKALLGIRDRATRGDQGAIRAWAILRQAARALPRSTAAGWAAVAGCGMPPGTVSGLQPQQADAPMTLHNYYQIMGGQPAGGPVASDFYNIGGAGLDCVAGPAVPYNGQHTHAVSCEPGAAAVSGHDWTIGANGKPDYKTWNGVRWIWSELRPHRGIRSEAQGFGLRDALLLGMQAMQNRELAAG